MMNVLVVAAHPDDEVLGCGGTIALHAERGDYVHVAILSEGITSRYDSEDHADRSLLETLHGNCRQAADMLGARGLTLPVFPDNRMDTVPLLEVIKHVERVVDEVQPEVVYTHHGGDLNVDHCVVFRAVMTACRPMQGHPVKRLYAFEIPSSTEWSFGRIGGVFNPNAFVDVSRTLDLKQRAMGAYVSEGAEFPHPRSSEAIEALARLRGSAVGVKAAEGFELVRELIKF